ncbi:outer membrane beta-barrel family protein [soil metagenome]
MIVLLFLLWQNGQSQNQVSGSIQSSDGKPLPYANVMLLNSKDSLLVKGAVSAENGSFQIDNIIYGHYLTAVSMVGYKKTYTVPFSISQNNPVQKLPLLTVHPEDLQLDEVTITAQKPLFEQHLDKLVVNVQSSITAAGSTALDVLERSPGVIVNRQNNGLSLNGKNGVLVMINGKISRLPIEAVVQMLNGMQANNIEKIELISNPSARYDAEGDGGIINIILKKNHEYGSHGSVALTMGYGAYEKPAASFSFNHRNRKINLYTDYSFLWNHYRVRYINDRQVINQDLLTHTTGLSNSDPISKNQTARIGFDYAVNSQTTLSGLISGFSNKTSFYQDNYMKIWENGQPAIALEAQQEDLNHWRHLMGNINFRHLFREGHEVNLDLDYLFYHHNNPQFYTNSYHFSPENFYRQDQMEISKGTPIRIRVGNVNYSGTLSTKTKLEAGLKASLSRLDNDVQVRNNYEGEWVVNPEFSGKMDMQEDIGAAFINFNHQISPKTKLQTGLRYEYTRTDLNVINTSNAPDRIRRRYGNLFPSIFLSHDVSKESSFQVSYGRRITRPTYNNLAPFVLFSDPFTFYSGNISLLPSITDALQTTFRFKKSYLVSLSYSYDKDPIIRWQVKIDPETNKQIARAENLIHSRTYSVNFSFPLIINNWWQMQYNLLGNWQQNYTNYEENDFQIAAGFGRFNATQTFTLPADYTLELTGFYQSRFLMGIAYIRGFGAFNAGLQKKLKNNKGILRLSIDDIFWTMRFDMINEQPSLNLNHRFLGRFGEGRVVRLTYSRNFGRQGVKAVNRRATGSDEERNRVGN